MILAGSHYVLNGVRFLLEEANVKKDNVNLPSGKKLRKDGRTPIIFKNRTMSNMLYLSLEKVLLNSANEGKTVSYSETEIERNYLII